MLESCSNRPSIDGNIWHIFCPIFEVAFFEKVWSLAKFVHFQSLDFYCCAGVFGVVSAMNLSHVSACAWVHKCIDTIFDDLKVICEVWHCPRYIMCFAFHGSFLFCDFRGRRNTFGTFLGSWFGLKNDIFQAASLCHKDWQQLSASMFDLEWHFSWQAQWMHHVLHPIGSSAQRLQISCVRLSNMKVVIPLRFASNRLLCAMGWRFPAPRLSNINVVIIFSSITFCIRPVALRTGLAVSCVTTIKHEWRSSIVFCNMTPHHITSHHMLDMCML